MNTTVIIRANKFIRDKIMKRSELWCDLRSHFTSITESNSDPLPFNNYNIKTPIAQHFDFKKNPIYLHFQV